MIDALLIVYVIFCVTVGFGLAINHINIYGVLGLTVVGIIAIQLGYFLTLVMDGHHG